MPRFRRALAAAAVAMIASGGALVTSAAGAGPAHAATAAAPVSHTMTVTAQRNSGISPQDIEPCAVPAPTSPTTQIAPATCGLPSSIVCFITVSVPVVSSSHTISAGASVQCSSPVREIHLTESLFGSDTVSIISQGRDDTEGLAVASVPLGGGACRPITYSNYGLAEVDFPDGYTPSAGAMDHSSTFTATKKACGITTGGGGGGGGGGCAIIAPSSSAQAAADRPRVIACP